MHFVLEFCYEWLLWILGGFPPPRYDPYPLLVFWPLCLLGLAVVFLFANFRVQVRGVFQNKCRHVVTCLCFDGYLARGEAGTEELARLRGEVNRLSLGWDTAIIERT
jgi:hypothetical protein